MKIRNAVLIMIVLITGSLSGTVNAQENLKALFKKCETRDDVVMIIVRNRDRNTQKESKESTTSITIKNNKALVDEFITAFDKDEPNTDNAVLSKKKGKTIPVFYEFKGVSFSFSLTDDTGNSAIITMVENSPDKK